MIENIKVVGLPKNGYLPFEVYGTIVLISSDGINRFINYVNHEAILPHDTEVTINVGSEGIDMEIETGEMFQIPTAIINVTDTFVTDIGHILDILKDGWVLV